MMVLDTHVWVWWVSQSRALPQRVRGLIDRDAAANPIYVSPDPDKAPLGSLERRGFLDRRLTLLPEGCGGLGVGGHLGWDRIESRT